MIKVTVTRTDDWLEEGVAVFTAEWAQKRTRYLMSTGETIDVVYRGMDSSDLRGALLAEFPKDTSIVGSVDMPDTLVPEEQPVTKRRPSKKV